MVINQISREILKEDEIKNRIRECFRKCATGRMQLRRCVDNVMDAGLTKEEVLGLSDDIVGGFGENEVSLCTIIAVNQVLAYEEHARTKPIDIVKEREMEREDT